MHYGECHCWQKQEVNLQGNDLRRMPSASLVSVQP
jgi:hypothetical protein